MSRSYTYVGKYSSQNERFGIYGILKGEKQFDDISKMGEFEVCIPKQGILVQGILRRYRREEYESDKGIHSPPIGTRQTK